MNNETLGWVSVFLAVAAAIPYYVSVFRGQVKPHMFSWAIWTLVLGIGFAAGHSKLAGPGVWSTAVACFNCFCITIVALFKGDRHYTRSDAACFICGLGAIMLWRITEDPLWSVIIIIVIDVLAFFPTMRKSYHRPYEESLSSFLIAGLNYAVALGAIEHWELVTWLYPASMVATCFSLVLLLAVRRKTIAAPAR